MQGSPVTIISIDAGRCANKTEEFLHEQKAVHTILNDPDRSAFDAYKIAGVPTTVVVDHAGRVMFRHVGFGEGMEEQFTKEIETLLAWLGEA